MSTHAAQTAGDAVRTAVDHLTRAGMLLHHTSSSGSCYLAWPGRSGLLRVSDHQIGRDAPNVIARITFNILSVPTSQEKMTEVIAGALGRYLLRSHVADQRSEEQTESLRSILVSFLKLPLDKKHEIARKLDLLELQDEGLSNADRSRLILSRAVQRGKTVEFAAAIKAARQVVDTHE